MHWGQKKKNLQVVTEHLNSFFWLHWTIRKSFNPCNKGFRVQFFRKQIDQNTHGWYISCRQNKLDKMHFFTDWFLCSWCFMYQCITDTVFPARKLIVNHERGKKYHPSKQRKLPAGFIQIRAGVGGTGFWRFWELPVKLASDAGEPIANLSCMPALWLLGLAAPNKTKTRLLALKISRGRNCCLRGI